MKTVAIFDYYLGGHHLEFIHHFYEKALKESHIHFIFILPTTFSHFSSRMNWEKQDNIEFKFFECDELKMRSMNIYKKAFLLSWILKRFTKELELSHVFLLETMCYMPFLPFFISNKISISSIIYFIPTYRGEGKMRKMDNLKYYIISKSKCFSHVYILNDKKTPYEYNKKYSVDKYAYLPDPYLSLQLDNKINIRLKYNIANNKKILLHFGGLTDRKGTLEILKAIKFLNFEYCNNYCFVFAGRVIEDIKEQFYNLIAEVSQKIQILVFDEFCQYDFLRQLCANADYVLIPYKSASQSSGVLAYAAQFHVPVIGPGFGLIGQIIKDYKLGISLDNTNYP